MPLQTSRVSLVELIFIEFDNGHDIDSFRRAGVVSTHFIIELIGNMLLWGSSEFFVKIVDSSSWSVFEVYSVILRGVVISFVDLHDLQDFSISFFDFVVDSAAFPELRSGKNGIFSEDSQNDNLGVGVGFCGESSSENQIFESSTCFVVTELSFHHGWFIKLSLFLI